MYIIDKNTHTHTHVYMVNFIMAFAPLAWASLIKP